MSTSWVRFVGGGRGPKGDPGLPGASYAAMSTTSLPVQTGTATIAPVGGTAALAYLVGTRIRIASAADITNYLEGRVTAITSTAYTVAVDHIGGSGTHADWNLSLAGDPGAQGLPGPQGPQGNPGPGTPPGGNDGEVITRVSGAPSWTSPAAFLQANGIPLSRVGTIVTLTDGSSVEGARFTPGANKAGTISLHARGRSDVPGDVLVDSDIAFVTDGTGKVFLQCCTVGGGTNPPPQGGPGTPGQPTNVNVVVNTGTNVSITISWTNGLGTITGTYVEASDDGGTTWYIPDANHDGGLVAIGSATSIDWDDSPRNGAPFKVRVRHFNDFGDSINSAVVSATYPNTGGSNGGGGGGAIIPIFPCARVTYDDAAYYFLGFALPSGHPASVTFFVEPQTNDIVFRAQSVVGHQAGIGFTAQITIN